MQQIRLSEFTESYAVSVEDGLPENEAVFFKTKDGRTFEGEFFVNHFDNMKGQTFSIEAVESFHPVTVDM